MLVENSLQKLYYSWLINNWYYYKDKVEWLYYSRCNFFLKNIHIQKQEKLRFTVAVKESFLWLFLYYIWECILNDVKNDYVSYQIASSMP